LAISYRKEVCTCHKEERYIVKRLPGRRLCNDGNEDRKRENKGGEASVSFSSIKPKKKKPTGERSLFLAIWATRPHICTNCNCDLGKEPKVHFFSHIVGKGRNPKLRLEPSNIQLLCQECHYAYDFQGEEKFLSRKK